MQVIQLSERLEEAEGGAESQVNPLKEEVLTRSWDKTTGRRGRGNKDGGSWSARNGGTFHK